MKVAVSAYGEDLNAEINPRFGRCDYILIVDTDQMRFESFSNDNKELSGGAGTQTACFVASKGVEAVLTGSCGPKAMNIFNAENIPVHTGQTGTVLEVVERFKKGTPTAPGSQPGMGGGSGTGGGRGMGGGGRGMGVGSGRGMGGGSGRNR